MKFAVEAGVLRFGQFRTKAGRLSPYFFNSALFDDGAKLMRLAEFYARRLLASGVAFDMLFGPAYKGITLASATAVELARLGRNVPFAYNRKEAKSHGEGGTLVGAPLAGRVVVIDDVITDGASKRESVELIRGASAEPAAVLIALDRMERGGTDDNLSAHSAVEDFTREHGLPVLAIATLADLLQYLDSDADPALCAASRRGRRIPPTLWSLINGDRVPRSPRAARWPGRCWCWRRPGCAQSPSRRAAKASTAANVNGKRVTSDRPIAECIDRRAEGAQPRRLREAHRAAHADAPKSAPRPKPASGPLLAEAAARKDAIRRDRNLVARFPNEAAHGKAREAALDDVRNSVRISRGPRQAADRPIASARSTRPSSMSARPCRRSSRPSSTPTTPRSTRSARWSRTRRLEVEPDQRALRRRTGAPAQALGGGACRLDRPAARRPRSRPHALPPRRRRRRAK